MASRSAALAVFCALIFLSNLLFSHFALPRLDRSDLFPFFTWNLFSFTPGKKEIFSVRVHKLDSTDMEGAELFMIISRIKPKSLKTLPFQINLFAKEVLRGHHSKKGRWQSEFERNAFHNFNSVQYELIYGEVDTLKFIRDRDVSDFKSIGYFIFERKNENQN